MSPKSLFRFLIFIVILVAGGIGIFWYINVLKKNISDTTPPGLIVRSLVLPAR